MSLIRSGSLLSSLTLLAWNADLSLGKLIWKLRSAL